jgi:3-oxoacyl-[acyl-carrier protein] reductase
MNILITGGNSDIAQAMAVVYHELGHSLTMTATSEQSCNKMHETFQKMNIPIQSLIFDLRSPENNTQKLEELLLSGHFQGLILNACTAVEKRLTFHEYSEKDWASELNDNILGNIWILKRILPSMKEQQFGRILFISSVTAISGTSKYAPYSLSKSAIESVMENIAVDYGHDGITANILRPGIVKTSRTEKYWKNEKYEKVFGRSIPSGRLATPQDIAMSSRIFLDKLNYSNGTSLNVSGGLPLVKSKGSL